MGVDELRRGERGAILPDMADAGHIIIDGWNAVRSNPAMEKVFLDSGLDAAREELWRLVGPLHDYGGARVTIVYDGRGEDVSILRRNGISTLSEVFTPSHMTADELIEQLCASSPNPSGITVVSRDNLLRLTATTFGATALAPDRLFEGARGCSRAMAESLRASNSAADREWKSGGAFAALDSFDLEVREAARRAGIISKHMKKRRRRLASAAEGRGGNGVPRAGSPAKKKEFSAKIKSFAALESKRVSPKKDSSEPRGAALEKPFSFKEALKKPMTLSEMAAAKILGDGPGRKKKRGR